MTTRRDPEHACPRIVFVHSSDERYGSDRVLLDIHDALPSELRDRASFWLPTDLPHGQRPLCVELEARGAHVRHVDLPVLRRAYRSPLGMARLGARVPGLLRELHRAAPDVVYCVTSAALVAAPLARMAGVPTVVAHVQEIWQHGDAKVLGTLARPATRMVAISRAVQESLPGRLRERTVIVPDSTGDPGGVVPCAERGHELTFLVASRWTPGKGLGRLLRVWDGPTPPGRLVVLGGPPPSGAGFDVRATVAGLRHRDVVDVVGEVPDVGPYVEAADVVVLPSETPEGFGLLCIEGFARGRPVVATAAGGVLDIVTPGHDGWLVPVGDEAALGDALHALSRESVVVAGTHARESFEARYTPAHFSAAWRAAMPWQS